MFGDLLGKFQEAQQKMLEGKQKLAEVVIDGDAGEGAVKVSVTGNGQVKTISINDQLLSAERKEELEDLLIIALNRALENAEKMREEEMKGLAGGMLGGMGLDL